MDMTSDTSLRSGEHPWTYDLLATEPSSPYPILSPYDEISTVRPTLSPYEDFSTLRPTTRSPPPLQVFTGQPESLVPPSPTSPHDYGHIRRPSLYSTDNSLIAKRPPPQRSHALGIDIPAVPRLSPRTQYARQVKQHNSTPQRLLLPNPPFAQTNLSPLSAHSSPSLSSSVTTAPSSPDSPCYNHQHSAYCSDWPLPYTEPIRTKRRFSNIRHAKRLPHHVEPQWEVHALIQVREYSADDDRHGSRAEDQQQFQQHQSKLDPEVDAAQLVRNSVEDGTTEHLLHEQDDFDTNLLAQRWPQTYVHYRGASFELINPRNSLLLGKSLIETPAAEIDLLIDDYLDSIEDTMSPPSPPGDLTPSRQLYSGPEEARRAILRIPQPDTLAIDGGLDGQASVPGENGESAISAILAGYDHTTPSTAPCRQGGAQEASTEQIPAHSPPVSETSEGDWLDFVRDAREASPALPFHAAIAKAHAETPSRILAATSTPVATAVVGHTDPATTERSYGDTNRLLQLTPQSRDPRGPVVVRGGDEVELYPQLRRVSASVGTIIHHDINRLPSQALSCDEYGSMASSQAATFYNPFDAEEYEREEEGDAEADWETENVPSEIDPHSREHSMDFAGFEYGYTFDRVNAGNEAAARDKRPVHDYDIDEASRQLSTIYNLQSTHSRDYLPNSQPDITEIQQAKNEIERIRRESPTVFQAAIDNFLQSHGQKTVDELSRVWPNNNYGKQSRLGESSFENVIRTAYDGKRSRLSENSFEHVIRTARMEEDRTHLASHPQTVVTQRNKAAEQTGLRYSPTTDTFATVRPPTRNPFAERLMRPDITITPPQPIYRTETDIAAMRRNINPRHANGKRPGLRSMASMSSQTGLRDLHLTSTPTSNIGDGAGHYTPITRLGGPARPIRAGHYPHWQQNRQRITPFPEQRWVEMDTLQSDGRTVRSAALPTLHHRTPEPVGRRIFNRHCWNPIALFMLAGGAYDNTVAIETHNEHCAVDRDLKAEALKWAILEVAAFVLAGTIIAFFVLIGTIKH